MYKKNPHPSHNDCHYLLENMITSVTISVVILAAFALQVNADYFWRPWTPRQAPRDAITGRDYRGVSYIVEATVPGWGGYVGQAWIGQSYINITAKNLTYTSTLHTLSSSSLKVLCSSEPNQLAWYPTSNSNLGNELITATITPVVGGVAGNKQLIYIGRFVQYNTQRTVHFGSVFSDDNQLLYSYNNVGYRQSYYELLVVNTHCSD